MRVPVAPSTIANVTRPVTAARVSAPVPPVALLIWIRLPGTGLPPTAARGSWREGLFRSQDAEMPDGVVDHQRRDVLEGVAVEEGPRPQLRLAGRKVRDQLDRRDAEAE